MFGKEQPNIQDEDDVGNYIAKLHAETPDPLVQIITEVEDGMAYDSERATTKPQGEDRLP